MSSLSATVQQPNLSRSDERQLISVVARMGIARQRTRHSSSEKLSLCSVPEDSALTAQNPMFESFTPSVESDKRAQQVLRASLAKGCTTNAKHSKGGRQPACVPNPASARRPALQKHCRLLFSCILRYCTQWDLQSHTNCREEDRSPCGRKALSESEGSFSLEEKAA